jgi:hypothetical protein
MPGSNYFGTKNGVMAYSENRKSIGTFDKKTVENNNLEIIQDPFLEVEWFEDEESEEPASPSTIIQCPRCNKTSLELEWVGLWD